MSLETINATLLDLKPEDLLLDLGSGEGRHTISFGLSQKITAIGLDLSHADLKKSFALKCSSIFMTIKHSCEK